MIGVNGLDGLSLVLVTKRNFEFDGGALVRFAQEGAGAVDFFHAAFHIDHAIAGVGALGRNSFAVVLDREGEKLGLRLQRDANFGGFGVFDGVIEGFLKCEEEVVSELSGELDFRKIDGEEKSAADLGDAEEFLGVAAEVVGELVERIMLRVDGPDDSVHGAHEMAGGGLDVVEGGLG